MKCNHENCKRIATRMNQQYHPEKWLCTYHSNKIIKEGRRTRKYGNRKGKLIVLPVIEI